MVTQIPIDIPIRPWRYRGQHRMGWREQLAARWAAWWATTTPRTPTDVTRTTRWS